VQEAVVAGSAPFAFRAIEDNLRHDTLLIQTTFDLGDSTFVMVASPEETIDFPIRKVWSRISRIYNTEANKYGGSMAIGQILLNIDPEGTPSTKLGPKMGMESRSLVRTLQTMEEEGLIKRIRARRTSAWCASTSPERQADARCEPQHRDQIQRGGAEPLHPSTTEQLPAGDVGTGSDTRTRTTLLKYDEPQRRRGRRDEYADRHFIAFLRASAPLRSTLKHQ
jgi:DNA-binding MarR family transcriptional regulator